MRTIAVVGANGFLGSELVRRFLDLKVNVTAVYNQRKDNIDKRATIMTSDELLDSDVNLQCIFFAIGNYTCSHKELLSINELLSAITGKFVNARCVYISSSNVYGSHSDIINETSSFNNPTLYALSKLAAEFIVTSLSNFSVIRFTYIYGPGITNQSFIPKLIKSAKENKKIMLFGNGVRKQDYIYINDAVDFCVRVWETDSNDIYLGATGISISNREVAEEIAKISKCEVQYTGIEMGDSYRFDPTLSFQKLQWAPKVAFTDGITQMMK
jgi:UDP-glucose 4-epimerase